jgi:hypothetical protein
VIDFSTRIRVDSGIASKTSEPSVYGDWDIIRFRTRNAIMTINNEPDDSSNAHRTLGLGCLRARTTHSQILNYQSYPHYVADNQYSYSFRYSLDPIVFGADDYRVPNMTFPYTITYPTTLSRLYITEALPTIPQSWKLFKYYIPKSMLVPPLDDEYDVFRYGLWIEDDGWTDVSGIFTADVDVYMGHYVMED